ncbi:hypothetical protein AWB90_20095 [Mycobacterium paraense]|uniref:Uncharacterized protein n=1 Tax=Mycobacterium paraense TaxID=767916 RepID=A0A1X2A627_9MYCO|nr:hypothetical protein [Mycobacterium paraense]ORW41606.1 hypothetical protein AWB90_20095 [Mycobacterium paraense]
MKYKAIVMSREPPVLLFVENAYVALATHKNDEDRIRALIELGFEKLSLILRELESKRLGTGAVFEIQVATIFSVAIDADQNSVVPRGAEMRYHNGRRLADLQQCRAMV